MNFGGAKLNLANLSGSDLRDANLVHADLIETTLSGADLSQAKLNWAHLTATQLLDSSLVGARLWFTEIINSALEGADFSQAYFFGTKLGGLDLSKVRGLEAVTHRGRSEISVSTIYKSAGKIPEVFLRGCGLPESFITRIASLVVASEPIHFYSCFISYSGRDQDFADRLHADLQDRGVRCWFAPEDLKIGDRFRDRIDESIRLHDKLLLILSENSVSSQWVGDEVEAAFEREQREGRTVLFPIRIDAAVMDSHKAWTATIRRTRHVGDFTRWKDHDSYQKALERLLRDLKAGA